MFWITFFCKNRIVLKILDFLSYIYTHHVQLKNFKIFHYSSLDNHSKLTEIGKNGKKSVFLATKATVKQFFPFFYDWQVTFMWESEKMKKSLMTFLLLFNSLKSSKTSLFCCNGYSHAIFSIIFYESQVEQLRKSITK